jgi:hypothetical protein
LDDLGVILLGLTTFIKLCPSDVVQYYRLQLDDYFDQEENEAVVDATYRRLDKE